MKIKFAEAHKYTGTIRAELEFLGQEEERIGAAYEDENLSESEKKALMDEYKVVRARISELHKTKP